MPTGLPPWMKGPNCGKIPTETTLPKGPGEILISPDGTGKIKPRPTGL